MSGELLDTLDVRAELSVIADALAATIDAVAGSGATPSISVGAVVLAGAPRSKVTSAMVAALAAQRCAVPMMVSPDGTLGDWVGSDTLVLALDAATGEALASTPAGARAHVIALGSGDATVRSSPILESAAALSVLGQLGVVDGVVDELTGAVDVLANRSAELSAEKSPAQRLARRIGRTMPLIYGAGPVGAAAGLAWKAAINRNAKAPAFTNSIPGLDFDEIAGWAQHGDVTRQVFSLVTLGHQFADVASTKRLAETAEICDEIVGGVYEVASDAPSATAALFDLALFGDFVSISMAQIAGVDPGPVPVTDRYTP